MSGWVSPARGARRRTAARGALLTAVAAALALAHVSPARAEAGASPWWRIGSEVTPTHLPPKEGREGKPGTGRIILTVSDLGDGRVSGAGSHPVLVTDRLPAGLVATAVAGGSPRGEPVKCEASEQLVKCAYAGSLNPYERLAITITTNVQIEQPPDSLTTLADEASVKGGLSEAGSEVPPAASALPVQVDGEPTPFGVQGYELGLFDEDGTPAVQAGSHPFQLTTTLVMNQTGLPGERQSVALAKDLRFGLPPGLIGDPNATARCTMTDFFARNKKVDLCAANTVVGVATVTVNEPAGLKVQTLTAPVFNLAPSEGEPARLGFEVLGVVFVVIDTSVDAERDYGVEAKVEDSTQSAWLLSSQVTLWGVPGDPRHDQSRGWECVEGGAHFGSKEVGTPCPASSELPQAPFLTLPSSCAAEPAREPLTSTAEVESWAAQGFVTASSVWSGPLGEALGLEPESCRQLPFEPAIGVSPEAHAASTPTGLSVDVDVPQGPTLEANPNGRAEADVRDTTVTLPEGVQVNPSAANGLQACPEKTAELPGGAVEGGIGFKGFVDFEPGAPTATFTESFDFTPPEHPTLGESFCPQASKLGLVRIKTPLLSRELEGAVYLAEPAPNGEPGKNPFDSLLALYIVAEDKQAGVLVKLAGEGELNQTTGQMKTVFANTPQLPFEELKLELFGGKRAPLSTPPACGDYAGDTKAQFTAWSGATAQALSESPFEIGSGPGGGQCPASPLPFAPSFDAQSSNTQAGAFTPFTLALERPDGQRALSGVEVRLPAGVAALLSSVTPCPEPPVGQPWACGEGSEIGHSLASSGLGDEPYLLEGKVYLTSGYDGAPFGLLVATEAKAGPFDLGMVYVRSRIDVNPQTAAVTIATDPGPHGDALPTMLDGIPVQLKRLEVTVDRERFQFNPTSCDPMKIEATLTGTEAGTGADPASAQASSPFQVGGCASLPFAPKLTASVAGHGSKADGTSLDVTIESPGLGQANIAKVDLQLPVALSSRLETLQKACPEATFDANPAGCDEGSVIGSAIVRTPVLRSPLSGPAYLVSHGGAAFPDVEFVLQGEGITLILDGKTDIKGGITYSRFESAPDAPFTSFETELPAGPHGVLTPNVPESEDFSLCKASLAMPTTIVAQDGDAIEQATNIAATGCGEVKGAKASKPTRAQLLAKALKSCRKDKRRSRRLACERQARKRYGATKAAHKTSKTANRNKRP